MEQNRKEIYKGYVTDALGGNNEACGMIQINVLGMEILSTVASLKMFEDLICAVHDGYETAKVSNIRKDINDYFNSLLGVIYNKQAFVTNSLKSMMNLGMKKEDLFDLSAEPIYIDLLNKAIMDMEENNE